MMRTRFFRLLGQNLLLALGQIWLKKTRSFLTTLGIIIGVASVTSVIAALTGLRAQVLREFAAVGINRIYIVPKRPDHGRHQNAPERVIEFRPPLFDALVEQCPSVGGLSRMILWGAKVRHAGNVINLPKVFGIEPSWHDIEDLRS